MPLTPELRRQRQADLWEFEANLVCKASSRTAKSTERNPAKTKYLSKVFWTEQIRSHTHVNGFEKRARDND